jgi:Predicted acyltransferases
MKNKIESIQILRGLAALAVVLFHHHFYLVPDGADRSIPDALFGWGGIGVDLFFVISGFIMIYVTDGKEPGLKTSVEFVINRLIRIIPLYYVVLLIAFLTGGAMSTFHYPDKVENLISALTFQPYLQSTAPMYIESAGMYNIRWTLNYEIYFYLIFSLCLLIKPRITALSLWFSLPLIVGYFHQGDFSLSTKGYEFNSVITGFLTNPIILEFGLGVIAGYLYKKINGRVDCRTIWIPALVLMLIALGIYGRYLTKYNLLSGIAFSVLVLTFALYNKPVTRFFPRCFITLGNISFSLYLVHNPVAHFISDKVEKRFPDSMHNVLGFIVLVTISILAGYFVHRYVETNLTRVLRRALKVGRAESQGGKPMQRDGAAGRVNRLN